nr:DivIVA domain-containing protein [Micromonospora sp. DSM 115978]
MLRLLRRPPTEYSWPSAPNPYRSTSRVPLRPWQVRNRRFALTRRWRRGVEPVEVHQFLSRVADDLATLYAQLQRTHDENIRIESALRQWRSRQSPPTTNQGSHW